MTLHRQDDILLRTAVAVECERLAHVEDVLLGDVDLGAELAAVRRLERGRTTNAQQVPGRCGSSTGISVPSLGLLAILLPFAQRASRWTVVILSS